LSSNCPRNLPICDPCQIIIGARKRSFTRKDEGGRQSTANTFYAIFLSGLTTMVLYLLPGLEK
jgi:hypothetical protein